MVPAGRQDAVLFLVQLAVMLCVALACGRAMHALRQPRVLGELIGGILLGPTLFGVLAPGLHAHLFPAEGSTAMLREGVLRIGMLFFMFVAGLEVQLSQARRLGKGIVCAGGLGVALPFMLGYGAVVLMPGLWGQPASAHPRALAMCIGTALSISALPIIGRILLDLGLMRSDVGVVVMASAAINDLLGWSVFALLPGAVASGGLPARGAVMWGVVGGAVLIVLGPGRWAGRVLLRRLRMPLVLPSGFLGVIAVLVLASAAGTDALGLHGIFGPFLLGVALGQGFKDDARQRAHETIIQFALSFFAPLYFVSIGLKVDFSANFDLALTAVILLVATLGKVVGGSLGARLGGMDARSALCVGFGLNARGAMAMILAAVALESGIIDRRIFVSLVTMAIVTSLISGPAMMAIMGRGGLGGSETKSGEQESQGRDHRSHS